MTNHLFVFLQRDIDELHRRKLHERIARRASKLVHQNRNSIGKNLQSCKKMNSVLSWI